MIGWLAMRNFFQWSSERETNTSYLWTATKALRWSEAYSPWETNIWKGMEGTWWNLPNCHGALRAGVALTSHQDQLWWCNDVDRVTWCWGLTSSVCKCLTWFQIGKGVCQGCILSPCLFNLDAEYIMRNARLNEAQAGIKIAGRNINNFRFADDTILTAESKEELKSLWMKVKEESEKVGLNLTFRKLRSWHPVPSLHGKQMGKKWKRWLT